MKCPHCQHENPEDSQFCLECGGKIELKCPNCSKVLPIGAKFCNGCGHDLRKPADSLPIDINQPQSYTPKHLANKILTTRSSIEGERKIVTVLFVDVANFTSISEKLDPEEIHQVMDSCFKILMDEIHKFEGTINQFTGDGVMALFGAPIAHENHAQRACHASLAIQTAIKAHAEKLKEDFEIEFSIRIGINTGLVVVGSIGDDLRMDYTADGDTVNLASRMESLAKPNTVLVSGYTYKLAENYFEFESLGKVRIKGKVDPQEAYILLRPSHVGTRIAASAARGLTRFVGRKRELETIREGFEKAKSGQGQVVGIVGEAGVGKSRLLLTFRNRLPRGDFTYLEGRCLHFGRPMAYLPILDILKSYFEIKEEDREPIIKKKLGAKILYLDEKLRGVIPPFQELLSLKVEDGEFVNLEAKEKRGRIFEAIRDLMIRECQEKPLILAIEDLHWMDKTSEEFLDYLIGWLANKPILLILLYRPGYTHQWGSKSYYMKIGLDQLDTESSTELVQAILEEEEVAPELRQLIFSRAAGNPLYMEEFTHTLLEKGSIERKEEQYILSCRVSDIKVPDTIQGIIAARMDRLEDNLKRTMQVASVIGRDFEFRILRAITGMRDELKSYLLHLQGLEFIYEKSLFPELEYIFKHALTQEVAYNSLLVKRRREIHEKIGKAIEEIYPESLEEFYEILAYHYSRSENLEKAYKYLRLAAENAASKYSTKESFDYYEKTLLILKKLSGTRKSHKEQLEIIHLMSGPMFILGFPGDSFQILEYGTRLSQETGDEKSLGIFFSWMGRFFTVRGGDPLLGVKYAEKSFQQAEKIGDVDLTVRAGFDLCTPYNISGQFYKQVDVSQKVVNLIEKTHRVGESFGTGLNLYSLLNGYIGFAHGMLGNFEKGKLFLDQGISTASEINDKPVLAHLEYLYGWVFLIAGDGKNTIRHFQNSIKFSEEVKSLVFLTLQRYLPPFDNSDNLFRLCER
jgi:class 3 adenylate cyclase/tetratricopeptide (TPR) repeat protein